MRPDDLTRERHRRDDLETRLRAALDERASGIAPEYRLDTILEQARATSPASRTAVRWTLGLVAAAAVIALALLVPNLLGGAPNAGPLTPGGPATTGDQVSAPSPSAPHTPEPTGPTTPADPSDPTQAPTQGPLAALPVYFPAHIGDALRDARLYREWVNVEGVGPDASTTERLTAALRVALAGEAPHTDGYLQFWGDVDLVDAQVAPERITVTLSASGPGSVSGEEARIAVQQLVWTAQAAVGQGTIPVRFVLADGSERLLGHLPVDRDYNRPATTDLYYEDLAPIWITSPTRYQALPGPDITVSGEATVFEGTVQWELIDDETGAVLDSGHSQASVGAPGRGTYTIPLTGLADGRYRIRVFELSMKDGVEVNAETSMPFFVGPAGPLPTEP
ncbi:MAG TPA: hypothetical protein GXZ60_09500 [Intrasporangiaceae bacterium]|nr:hypothetical protein [Intrasporangiaceae bacterium]